MTYAYDENLLDKARLTLASMFDYAVNDCGLMLEDFFNRFIQSGLAESFSIGESSIVAGKSGIELAREVIYGDNYSVKCPEPSYGINRTREFWLGDSLAYYQWYKNISFERIIEGIGIDYIIDLYDPYHEMHIMSFVECLDETRSRLNKYSALKRLRTYANLSQGGLSKASGVPVRTIQQYEQGRKDIKKASFETIVSLSKALHCSLEQLCD